MTLGMVISDATRADTPVVYCNPGFERLTGYTADENTEKMLAEAEAAGTVGEQYMSAQDRMADATERVADMLEMS